VKVRIAPCSGCGKRFRHRELYEVTEDHLEWTLAFFGGELLCEGCACDHGIL
jgi:hypothetical protein